MKIDKRNPAHWAYLVRSGLAMAAAAALRPVLKRNEPATVLLYSHAFGGNLTALTDYAAKNIPGHYDFAFVGLDEAYLARLDDESHPGLRTLSMLRLRDTLQMARARAVVTDRNAVTLEILKKLTSLPFIDVWHGVPFKGFTEKNFRYLRDYTEVWVTGDGAAGLYVNQFGVPSSIVHSTGYARTDRLVNRDYDAVKLKAAYGIEESFDKIVLLAPTWKQDDSNRSIIPYGVAPEEFFEGLNKLGEANNALIIFRAHLHVGGADAFTSYPYVRNMSNRDYPLIEEFLFLADIVVTDWSSLAFDYLALERPTVFLDVAAPFKDGFSVPPEHRFGYHAANYADFIDALRRYLSEPQSFADEYQAAMDATREFIYGENLDGKTAKRQLARLANLLR
jgi:CDP-glycerol glycerophosphotransferase